MINDKIKLFSGLIASSLLIACSSMDVDDTTAENWPSDFQLSEYSAINPDIAVVQLRDTVAAINLASGDTAKVESDIIAFFDSEVSVKTLFTDYALLNEALWPGFEALRDSVLNIDLRNLVLEYHVFGNTATQDLAFLQSAGIVDSSLIAWQYLLYGAKEGRAYRYCLSGEAKTLQSTDQAVAIRSLYDYSANSYCLNESDDQIYLIEK